MLRSTILFVIFPIGVGSFFAAVATKSHDRGPDFLIGFLASMGIAMIISAIMKSRDRNAYINELIDSGFSVHHRIKNRVLFDTANRKVALITNAGTKVIDFETVSRIEWEVNEKNNCTLRFFLNDLADPIFNVPIDSKNQLEQEYARVLLLLNHEQQ
jgi:hypothetical protein